MNPVVLSLEMAGVGPFRVLSNPTQFVMLDWFQETAGSWQLLPKPLAPVGREGWLLGTGASPGESFPSRAVCSASPGLGAALGGMGTLGTIRDPLLSPGSEQVTYPWKPGPGQADVGLVLPSGSGSHSNPALEMSLLLIPGN